MLSNKMLVGFCGILLGSSVAVAQPIPFPDGFLFGTKYGDPTFGTPGTVTWSFQATGPNQVDLNTFMPAGYADEIRAAMQTWSDVANITFEEVASGGQLRIFGQSIDGPGGIGGQAQFPGPGNRFLRFDRDNTFTPGNIYQLALHELGHSIGLNHPSGVIAAMDHAVTGAIQGLLPVDVGGAQAIYGAPAGFDTSLYLPVDVTTLSVLPTSNLTVTVSLGALSASASTHLSGSLNARLDVSGGSGGVAFYGADLSINDVSVAVDDPLLSVDADFTGLLGDLFSEDWFGPGGHLTPVSAGQFAVDNLIFGLDGGQVSYAVDAAFLGVNLSGLLSFFSVNTTGAGPHSLAATHAGLLGLIDVLGSQVDLEIPIFATSVIRVPAGGLEIPVELQVEGTIYATASVPEVSTFAMVMSAVGIALACGITRGRVHGRRTESISS